MTSGKGPLGDLSVTDIEKLLDKFMEFAVVNKRNIAIKAITDDNQIGGGFNSDIEKFQHFKTLFNVSSTASSGKTNSGPRVAAAADDNTLDSKTSFVESNEILDLMKDPIDDEYETLKKRIKEEKR